MRASTLYFPIFHGITTLTSHWSITEQREGDFRPTDIWGLFQQNTAHHGARAGYYQASGWRGSSGIGSCMVFR